MRRPRLGLRSKFNLVMALSFLIGLGLAAVFVQFFSERLARRAVFNEAAMVMAELEATIHYTETNVSPLFDRPMKVQFIPQAIPFFAAQRTFDLLAEKHQGFVLRQPATNPTNVLDRPEPWEADIIARFQANSVMPDLTTERNTPSGRMMSYSRPVRVIDPGCLACHSTPAAAPSSLIDVYGSKNGFGWKLGSVIGAEIVSIPEHVALAQARQTAYLIMTGLFVVFVVMLVVLNLLLYKTIIKPVRTISHMADDVSLGNLEAPEFRTGAADEIGSLAISFNRMRRSLVTAFQLLEGQE